MQIKITRNHYTPIRMAELERLAIPTIGKDAEELELSYVAGGM